MSDLDRIEKLGDFDMAMSFLRAYEKENARLHRRLQEVLDELAKVKGEGAKQQLQLELTQIKEQLDGLRQRLFGDSSERRPKDKPKKKAAKKTGHGPRPQPKLPVKPQLLLLSEEDRSCPKCGGHLEEIKGETEDAEIIDVIQQYFVLLQQQRQKYSCGCSIHTTPSPPRHIEGGRYSLRFAVAVAIAKYVMARGKGTRASSAAGTRPGSAEGTRSSSAEGTRPS